MTAYIVFTREITTDQAELDIYYAKAVPTLGGHPATVHAFYGNQEVLEGPGFEGTVILSFPTADDARAWYHSPAYQAAIGHRKAGSDYRVFIVDGVPAAE